MEANPGTYLVPANRSDVAIFPLQATMTPAAPALPDLERQVNEEQPLAIQIFFGPSSRQNKPIPCTITSPTHFAKSAGSREVTCDPTGL
nr:uncharacterized protein CTRU02_11415 [Colletotrichum truncatum]KAF6785790.1 hypothetical protein CTRU02_11415 [Colletotrichum truncatum]